MPSRALSLLLTCTLVCTATFAQAGPIRDRIEAYRAEHQDSELEEGEAAGQAQLPAGARLLANIRYGDAAAQRMDVYLPAQAQGAPVIFMVHGGGWRHGDKAAASVVQNKMTRWIEHGFVFVSINYRLLPGTQVDEQAKDVVRALASAQSKAAEWGADGSRFILMGHSAGAHLIALLAARPALALDAGARPWLGTVALDSAAYDVEQIMQARHLRLYDTAFGEDAAYWRAMSPYHVLVPGGAPLLAACSSRRSDSCQQAERFAARAGQANMRVQVLPEDLSHREINVQLGLPGRYTEDVETFMASLDSGVEQLLAGR
jgi:acetyl esterase/lipase